MVIFEPLPLFRMLFFIAAHGWGEGRQQKASLPKICCTYHTMMKLDTVIPYLKEIQKLYGHPFIFADISIFYRKFFAKNLMMPAKKAASVFLWIKIFWKKVYHAIIFVADVSNKILPRDSNYNVDVVMWPKFGNSSISVWEVIITSIL